MFENQLNKEKHPKSTWANAMRRFGIIIMIVFSVIGFVIGAVWGVIALPFSIDDFANILPGGMIGLLLGGIIGVISMAVIMYLAELGINLRKTAENTQIKSDNTLFNADELKKYKDLLDAGAITQAEFETKKKQLMDL